MYWLKNIVYWFTKKYYISPYKDVVYTASHKKVYTYFIKKYVIYPFDLILYATLPCTKSSVLYTPFDGSIHHKEDKNWRQLFKPVWKYVIESLAKIWFILHYHKVTIYNITEILFWYILIITPTPFRAPQVHSKQRVRAPYIFKSWQYMLTF